MEDSNGSWSALAERYRCAGLDRREITHAELWGALGPVIEKSSDLSREEAGRSVEERPLYLVRYGEGPTRVLLWSQMHGNESTGTRALADFFRFLASEPEHAVARLLREKLTILALPMLNPDGAQVFRRRNAQGIDINRDARLQSSPEAGTLWKVHERARPEWAIELHDESVLKRVGESDRFVAVSLQAPLARKGNDADEAPVQARRLAAVVRNAIEPLVGDHITRYPATYDPLTFGTPMQEQGTTTLLFETGGWTDDPEKEHLRTTTFVALLSALERIARGEVEREDPSAYDDLPVNGSRMVDLLLRGGSVVIPGAPAYRADVAVSFADPIERRDGRIQDVGDLEGKVAFRTLDCEGLYLHAMQPALRRSHLEHGADLAIGSSAAFIVREGESPESPIAWVVDAGDVRPGGGGNG